MLIRTAKGGAFVLSALGRGGSQVREWALVACSLAGLRGLGEGDTRSSRAVIVRPGCLGSLQVLSFFPVRVLGMSYGQLGLAATAFLLTGPSCVPPNVIG